MVIEITSLHNPKVKLATKLWDRRAREKTGQFLIEGYRELSRAIDNGEQIEVLFFCKELFLGSSEMALIEKCAKKEAFIYQTSEKVFKSFSYRDRPDGLIAIAKMHHTSLSELTLSSNPFLIVAEAIEKPGNLGTILRSADGAGVEGVIVSDRCTDIFNPNVVRSSVGTLFSLPVVESSSDESIQWLKKNKIKIVAATPEASVDYTKADFTGPIAIVVGTEQYGLSQKMKNEADIHVKIPMMGVADSLNVGVATALLLYEVHRQRHS